MTVTPIHATSPIATTPTHPIVAALLAIADSRRELEGDTWDAIVAGFGPSIDNIADDLRFAVEYESGLTDHEAPTAAKADAKAKSLRNDASHNAAFLASLLINGGAR